MGKTKRTRMEMYNSKRMKNKSKTNGTQLIVNEWVKQQNENEWEIDNSTRMGNN